MLEDGFRPVPMDLTDLGLDHEILSQGGAEPHCPQWWTVHLVHAT